VRIAGERERKFDPDAESTCGRGCVKSQSWTTTLQTLVRTPVKKANLPCEPR